MLYARQRRQDPGFLGSALARAWPWLLGAGLFGYLGLVPGMVLVTGLMFVAFAGLILSLVAARIYDHLTAGRSS